VCPPADILIKHLSNMSQDLQLGITCSAIHNTASSLSVCTTHVNSGCGEDKTFASVLYRTQYYQPCFTRTGKNSSAHKATLKWLGHFTQASASELDFEGEAVGTRANSIYSTVPRKIPFEVSQR
jgi:hypothetical protein